VAAGDPLVDGADLDPAVSGGLLGVDEAVSPGYLHRGSPPEDAKNAPGGALGHGCVTATHNVHVITARMQENAHGYMGIRSHPANVDTISEMAYSMGMAPKTIIRTDRDGYVRDGGTLIGKVEHHSDGWRAYVQSAWNDLEMRLAGGPFVLKRDAVSEVVIMREA
jgi:hypothetical protein